MVGSGSSSGVRINRLSTPTQQPLTQVQITSLRTEVERLQSLLNTISNNVAGQVIGASSLSEGDASDDVRLLQAKLRALGFFTFPTDTGYFGPITRASVMVYQLSKGIPNTGFVGSLTLAELNRQDI